jgi:hypothetical protein
MLSAGFLAEFKRATEARWREAAINPTLYGYQFQRGTRWNTVYPMNKWPNTKAFSAFGSPTIWWVILRRPAAFREADFSGVDGQWLCGDCDRWHPLGEVEKCNN